MLIGFALGVVASVVVYLERRRLKAALAVAEAAAKAKAENIEGAVKAKARADIAAVLSEIKFGISKGEQYLAHEVVAKIEAAVKAAL
jgi:hypothetical protein